MNSALDDNLNLETIFSSFNSINPSDIDSNTILKTRLSLMPLNEIVLSRYLQDLCEYSKIDSFYEHLEYPPFKNDEECSNYFMTALDAVKNHNEMIWVVLLKSEDKAIGTIKLCNWHLQRKLVHIGYGISPAYGKKGYFKEALSLIISFSFNVLKFYRIEAWTGRKNIGSRKGLASLGFSHEATLRERCLKFDGNRMDVVIYSILKSD